MRYLEMMIWKSDPDPTTGRKAVEGSCQMHWKHPI